MAIQAYQSLGCLKDGPDSRDLRLQEASQRITGGLPSFSDLSGNFPAVYDQRRLGSCTAQGLAAAYDYERGRQGLTFMDPSRLFIYFEERRREGTVARDAGASIRTGIKVLNQGVCPESEWPYYTTKFRTRPPKSCYDAARLNHTLEYARVPQALGDMRFLLSQGMPVIMGISVFPSFMSQTVAVDGQVPVPRDWEKPIGGHAIVAVGHNDPAGVFKCRNSWGVGWGLEGYFYLPYAYAANPGLAHDLWAIGLVTAGTPAQMRLRIAA